MTSSSGTIHSEGPSDAFLQRGENLELIQLCLMENAIGKIEYYNLVGYIAIAAKIIANFIGRK